MKAFIVFTLFVAVSALPRNMPGPFSGPEPQLRHWEPEPPAPEPNEENEVPPVISPSSILEDILAELARSHDEDFDDREERVSLGDIVNALNALQDILQNHGGDQALPEESDSDGESESQEEEPDNENVSSEPSPSSNGSAPDEQNESGSENQGSESGNESSESEADVAVVRRSAPFQNVDILADLAKPHNLDSDDSEERISLEDIVNALNILKEILQNHGGAQESPDDDEPHGEKPESNGESESEEEDLDNGEHTEPSPPNNSSAPAEQNEQIESQIPRGASNVVIQQDDRVQPILNRPLRLPSHALPQDLPIYHQLQHE